MVRQGNEQQGQTAEHRTQFETAAPDDSAEGKDDNDYADKKGVKDEEPNHQPKKSDSQRRQERMKKFAEYIEPQYASDKEDIAWEVLCDKVKVRDGYVPLATVMKDQRLRFRRLTV